MKAKSIVGFTLAEVLITLLIIGVVSSIVIPALINNTNEAELRTMWKKKLAEINQAVSLYQLTDGMIDFSTPDSMMNCLSKKYNVIKRDVVTNIFPPFYLFYKNTSGQGDAIGTTDSSVILSDGTYIGFDVEDTNCSRTQGNLHNICGYFYVDVNGLKKPNMFGKDLFMCWLVNKNNNVIVVPIGSNDDGRSCVSNSSSWQTSEGCSALSLYTDKMP